MSCNCEYGKCDQSFGCPVRATPAECLKAGACQADPCHCETLDKSIVSTKEVGVWSAILFFVVAGLSVWLVWQHPVLLTQFF